MTRVICQLEMTYNGIHRYKGELFGLIGAINDDKLVRVGHVRVIDGVMSQRLQSVVRDDATGREFIDEPSLRAYRMAAPRDAQIVVRRVGRPRGKGGKTPKTGGTVVVEDDE